MFALFTAEKPLLTAGLNSGRPLNVLQRTIDSSLLLKRVLMRLKAYCVEHLKVLPKNLLLRWCKCFGERGKVG